MRPIVGKLELVRSLRTGDLAKARKLTAIEDARGQAILAKAHRQLDAQRAVATGLTESELWSLAANWLIENEKRTPVDRPPAEHVEEAL